MTLWSHVIECGHSVLTEDLKSCMAFHVIFFIFSFTDNVMMVLERTLICSV